jgi:hypothetical protein
MARDEPQAHFGTGTLFGEVRMTSDIEHLHNDVAMVVHGWLNTNPRTDFERVQHVLALSNYFLSTSTYIMELATVAETKPSSEHLKIIQNYKASDETNYIEKCLAHAGVDKIHQFTRGQAEKIVARIQQKK